MDGKTRWGILGCGNIANKFAADLKYVEDAELVAVASRDHQKAIEFSKKYGARFAFDSYDALADSPDVDVIYIATPHGYHYEHAMLCMRRNKAVLCEKAFALNSHQVEQMIEAAKRHHVFLMEAFWTKFIPQYEMLASVIERGEIGKVKMIQADFGFKAPTPSKQRLYDPALGGGALLDIGIYPVFLATSLLGRPSDVCALMKPYPSGVDQQIAIVLKFENGALANLSATFEADTPVEAIISGDNGYIKLSNRFHNMSANMEIVKKSAPVEVLNVHREEGTGYQFEARHVGACLRDKLIESPVMRHRDSLLLMETLDRIRASCGISYPADQKKNL
jgi:predicted dehydrogenase